MLWKCLKNKQTGHVFNRQRPILNYIADFYCSKAMLAIELDGSQHYDDANISYDKKRTDTIEGYNIEVLRFSNREIDDRFHDVCETINKAVEERIISLKSKSVK